MHLNDKNTLCDFLSFKCILARMSRDFDIFMSKHLAGQWLLNSYKLNIKRFFASFSIYIEMNL